MAACASQVITHITGSGSLAMGGRNFSSGTAVFPTGAATASVTVGMYTPNSIVHVRNQALSSGGKRIIPITSRSFYGNKGNLAVGTVNGVNSSATCAFHWMIINP